MASGGGYRQMGGTTLLDSIKRYGQEGFGPAFFKLIKQLAVGSTVRLVSNCEDVADWDVENSSYFNAVNETSTKMTGSNAIELVDVGTTKGTCVTMDEDHRPDSEDWTDFNWLGLWVYDDTALRLAGELTFQIRNNGIWSAEIAVPVCTTASMWELHCINLEAYSRGKVDGFRFVNRRGTGSSEKVYIDKIFVTDLIAGNGDASQCATGPVLGQCGIFPVAAGQTLNPGEFVNLEAGEANAGVQNDTAVIGVVVQSTAFTSVVGADALPTEVMVALEGSIVALRNDGTGCTAADGVIIASGNVTVADGTTNITKRVAVALDAGTAYSDTVYKLCGGYLES